MIRPADTADIPHITALAAAIWPHAYAPIIGEEQVLYMLGRIYSREALLTQMEEGQRFLLSVQEARIVGFAAFSKVEDNIYKLNKLYVLPQLQGAGLGKALLSAVISEVRLLGAQALILNVNRDNPAKVFYEQAGFAVLREEDIDIGGGYFMNDFVMSRKVVA